MDFQKKYNHWTNKKGRPYMVTMSNHKKNHLVDWTFSNINTVLLYKMMDMQKIREIMEMNVIFNQMKMNRKMYQTLEETDLNRNKESIMEQLDNEMMDYDNTIQRIKKNLTENVKNYFDLLYEKIFESREKYITSMMLELLEIEKKLLDDKITRSINHKKNEDARIKNMDESKRRRGKLSMCTTDRITCDEFDENEKQVIIHKTQRCKHAISEDYVISWLKKHMDELSLEPKYILEPYMMTEKSIKKAIMSLNVQCNLPDYIRNDHKKIVDSLSFDNICKTYVNLYNIINKLSTNDMKKQYVDILTKGFGMAYRKTILQMGKYVECIFCTDPTFYKSYGTKYEIGQTFLMTNTNVRICMTCNKCWCGTCKMIYLLNSDNQQISHNFLSCAEVEEMIATNDPEHFKKKQDEKYIATFTKKCPKCSVRIEKNEGCNHMICTHCNTHYCWKCDMIFKNDPDMSATIYLHMEMHFQDEFGIIE